MNKLYLALRRITNGKEYLPEVDGIRFLAITLVVFFHAYGYFHDRFDKAVIKSGEGFYWINSLMLNGDRGVQLFFVLSGFILCLPFARGFINSEKLPNIKKYYVRRLTRLEPPYFIVMIVCFAGLVFTKVYSFPFLFPSLLASLIYAHGFFFNITPYVNVVAWSLEVEIQFYLMAPLLFQVLKLSPLIRRSILLTVVLLFISFQPFYFFSYFTFLGQAQYFLIGILLADLYVSNFMDQLVKKEWVVIVSIFLLITICYLPIKSVQVFNFIFPFLILLFYYMVLKNEMLKKVFSYKWIPIIGGMCYSIYLLHFVVISIVGRFLIHLTITENYLINMIFQLGLLISSILIISSVFYLLIERPFMSGKWSDMQMKHEKKNLVI